MTWRFGWCTDGHHAGCPRVIESRQLPDPAKPGTFYTTKRGECPCTCHNRVEREIRHARSE